MLIGLMNNTDGVWVPVVGETVCAVAFNEMAKGVTSSNGIASATLNIPWNATIGEHSFGWIIVGAPNIQISMIGGGPAFAVTQGNSTTSFNTEVSSTCY